MLYVKKRKIGWSSKRVMPSFLKWSMQYIAQLEALVNAVKK